MLNVYVLIEIFNLLDLKAEINIISTSHYLKNNMFVTDLYNQDNIILKKLTTTILKQKTFINVIKLNANYNKLITDLSFIKKLKILCAKGECGIDQNCINCLNLIELNAYNNEKIQNVEKVPFVLHSKNNGRLSSICCTANVSFMKNFKKLNASQNLLRNQICGIDQNGINGLNLIELDAENNKKINNVSFMSNLQKLNASGEECGINQNGINDLNLIKLNACYNKKIKNISFMTNLQKLNIEGYYGIDQNGIEGLNLIKLDAYNNEKIIDVVRFHRFLHSKNNETLTSICYTANVSFMNNLQKLDGGGDCGIDQNGINGLNLIELYALYNGKIMDVARFHRFLHSKNNETLTSICCTTNVSFMSNLQKLYAGIYCGIDQNGINDLNLIELNAKNNEKIKNVSFMSNLQRLNASGENCGIDQNGITGLNLFILNINDNNKITVL